MPQRPPGGRMPPEMGVSLSSKMADTGDPWGIKVALITRVDEIHMKADIKVITGGGDNFELDLTQGMAGPRSFWGGVPEVNSLCVIGYRRKSKQIYHPVILAYIPVGQRLGMNFEPLSPIDPSEVDPSEAAFVSKFFGPTVRYKRLKLRPGDVGGMSSAGAELVLSKDAKFCNRAGDLFELRDADRTLIAQSVHRVESSAGVYEVTGPIRRTQMFLPSDIFQSDGVTLKTEDSRYFGSSELQSTGPDPAVGGPYRYANTSGKILNLLNNGTGEFPPVTYSSGKRAFYPATSVASNFEDPTTPARAYTERRVEISHTTDNTQEVRDEIDGFQIDAPRVYIEHVEGTIVGNDAFSSRGLRQYGRLLKPKIFEDVTSDVQAPGKFELQEVPRSPTEPDVESDTTAGAYLLRIVPPSNQTDTDTQFALGISKQGKVFLNIPGSQVERYPSGSKNVSAEVNLEGALKMFLGAETAFGASLIVDMVGGIKAHVGHNATGHAIDVTYDSIVKQTYSSAPADDQGQHLAIDTTVIGDENKSLTGDHVVNALGQISHTANGAFIMRGDTISQSASGGLTGNYGGLQLTVTDKTNYNHAQQIMKTIQTGGEVVTILAGGLTHTVAAGTRVYTTSAGATTFSNPAGAFSISVGTGTYSVDVAGGALSMTASAAMSLSSAAAVSITASGAMTLTSPSVVSLVAPQLLLGGPPAVLGVARGTPMMPPGTPSLDWITGLPLQGCSVVRSL